jgi:hypothetical protein
LTTDDLILELVTIGRRATPDEVGTIITEVTIAALAELAGVAAGTHRPAEAQPA